MRLKLGGEEIIIFFISSGRESGVKLFQQSCWLAQIWRVRATRLCCKRADFVCAILGGLYNSNDMYSNCPKGSQRWWLLVSRWSFREQGRDLASKYTIGTGTLWGTNPMMIQKNKKLRYHWDLLCPGSSITVKCPGDLRSKTGNEREILLVHFFWLASPLCHTVTTNIATMSTRICQVQESRPYFILV